MYSYINLHTHTFLNQKNCLEIVNNYPNEALESAFFSVGIHPWHINENWQKELVLVTEKLKLSNNVALGECGLDNRIDVPMDIQLTVFKAQLMLAEQLKKPVIIHCVGAFQEVIRLKIDLKITVPMVIHGFSKNNQIAEQLVKHGFYLSFGKYLFLNPTLPEVFKETPLENIFLETDTSHFSIEEVYQKAATIKNISTDFLIKKIKASFEKLKPNNCTY